MQLIHVPICVAIVDIKKLNLNKKLNVNANLFGKLKTKKNVQYTTLILYV